MLRPESLNLSIGAAPLRNHWTCTQLFLHEDSVLTADVSAGTEGFTKSATTPIFSLHVEVNESTQTIHVRNGDVAELLATAFARMHGLASSYVPPLVAEIYRGLAKSFATVVQHLQAELDEKSSINLNRGMETFIENQGRCKSVRNRM